MNYYLARFYAGLSFLYFSDMTLLISVMWLSYEITQSAFVLSLILTFSAILPLALRKTTSRLNLLSLNLAQLMKLRISLYLCLSIIALCVGNTMLGLIGLGFLAGILSVTILSSYEATNTQLVLEGKIEKSLSARIMQTVIQVGAFIGAMLGSLMLKHIGFEYTIWLISALDITVCLILLYFERQNATSPTLSEDREKVSPQKQRFIYIISGLLGLIALHISTFNLTVPIIFQTLNQWQITDFGLASGTAGLGAFCAVFFKHSQARYQSLLLLLIIVDISFTFNQHPWLIAPLCFTIGFCINSIRIAVREKLISLAENHQQASYISGISASLYFIFQSFGTLCFGILLGIFPSDHLTQSLLPFMALCITLIFLHYYKKEM